MLIHKTRLLLIFVLLISAVATQAIVIHAQEGTDGQDDDKVSTAPILYGDVVEQTITDQAYFDHWIFFGEAGDIVTVRMVAADGLMPLIGVITQGGDLLARSDMQPDGTRVDVPVNGIAELRFTVQQPGDYTIVATRVGNDNGTTVGSYKLSLTVEIPPINDLQEVVFRCGEYEITTAMTMEFNSDGDDGALYRITVYGLDGFMPYIRIDFPTTPAQSDCTSDGSQTIGDIYMLPDRELETVIEGSPFTAQHILQGMEQIGTLTLIIGSRDGAPGKYVAVIEGFSIGRPGDTDTVALRLGPLASQTEMFAYMIRDGRSRIDPQVRLVSENPSIDFTCDDAGKLACADIPAADTFQFTMADGKIISGDTLDAGVRIATGSPDRVAVQFASRSATTQGGYAVVLMGELPPPPVPED